MVPAVGVGALLGVSSSMATDMVVGSWSWMGASCGLDGLNSGLVKNQGQLRKGQALGVKSELGRLGVGRSGASRGMETSSKAEPFAAHE